MPSSYETEIREKIKYLGSLMGFDIKEEWTPPQMNEYSRFEVYKPRIDLIWYKNSNRKFLEFMILFSDQASIAPYKILVKKL
jgi:hypothetical protein